MSEALDVLGGVRVHMLLSIVHMLLSIVVVQSVGLALPLCGPKSLPEGDP